MNKFKHYIENLLDGQKRTFDEDNLRGYVDHFLAEVQHTSEHHYSDKQLIVTLIDFFTGGSGTMSKTLGFAFLYCLQHEEVLLKVQDEIDQVTEGRDLVTLEDRVRMVYTEATLLEVARLGSVLPIAPPRQCSESVKVGDHVIPRGGLVQMNLYSLHRNNQHWSHPHQFKPERFIRDGAVVHVRINIWLDFSSTKLNIQLG